LRPFGSTASKLLSKISLTEPPRPPIDLALLFGSTSPERSVPRDLRGFRRRFGFGRR
jgi:hypothetical protein